MNLAGFEWDRGNREKCQKHCVSIEEIEAMLHTARVAPDMKHSQAEDRFIATGRNSKAGRCSSHLSSGRKRGES